MRQTIVLTGGNGLLGFETLRILSENPLFEIVSLQQHIDATSSLPNVTYLQADLTDPSFVDTLPQQAFAIIHLAQSNHFRLFPEKALDIFGINCQATQLLLDYAVKASVKKFIYTSTGGVYSGVQTSFKEEDAANFSTTSGYYASSKYMAELLVQNYNALFDTIIFRPFFMYGIRQKKDMLIPRLIANVKAGNPITLDGEEGLKINPIHVNDAAIALVNSLQIQGSHIFNLGGNTVVSLKQIGMLIGTALQQEVIFKYNTDKTTKDLVGDINSLISLLHQPKINITEGINELIEHEK